MALVSSQLHASGVVQALQPFNGVSPRSCKKTKHGVVQALQPSNWSQSSFLQDLQVNSRAFPALLDFRGTNLSAHGLCLSTPAGICLLMAQA